ncbi:MAG: DUF3018 family protein [Proteobacteria bacterium]|nr:DUF3018 family protein [Pseudomonadota bacterium]
MPDVTPDMRRPGFAQECQRQCLLAAQADKADVALQAFMEGVLLDDQVGWTDTDETPRSTASRPEDFRGQGKGGGTKALLCDRVTDRAKE